MNKKLITFLVASASVITLSSCRKKNPDLSSNVAKYSFPGSGYVGNDYFAVTKPIMKLAPGESGNIELDSYPTSYANKGLTFESKNTGVATVNALGVISAVAKGITDVVIKDASGAEVGKVRVAVATESSSSGSASVINAIKDAYADSEAPSKVIQYEYSYEYYKKEGQIVTGNESAEIMAYDAENGYFYVEGPFLTYKTQGGAPEISDGKWVFYTIQEGLFTRILHITSTGKKFYDLNTANYTSNDKIIRDIMNFFFVSGEKIVTDLLDGYYGKDNFTKYAESSGGICSIGSNSLYYTLEEAGSDTVSADDEINYFNIPTDTKYTYSFYEGILQQGTRVSGLDIELDMRYKLGEENWSRVFNRKKIYDNTFEETKVKDPDKNGYKQVDSLYDL